MVPGLVGAIVGAIFNFMIQFALNLTANGGDYRLALKCINWTSVLTAAVAGALLPGVGQTFISMLRWAFGLAPGAIVIENGALFLFLGVPYKFGFDQILPRVSPGEYGDGCECNSSNTGPAGAGTNFY